MYKGNYTRKHNKLLTARNHYFKFGDFLFKPGPDGQVTNRNIGNMSELGEGILKAAGTISGQVGGNLISGGMQSGVGNVLQGLSGVASAIPGPWGAVASAGLGLVGGLTNRIFGSKMNTDNIAKVEANINNLNSFQSNAQDFNTLASNWSNASTGMVFNDSFIGRDGWLSNKAKNKAADLRNQIQAGNTWVHNSLTNNAENISSTQMQNLLANYTALGGPLYFSDGGSIYIKPENRGKFNALKKRTGKTTEELTHSKNPLTRKRAIFAQNAKKWHHAFGGELGTNGSDFTNGIIEINSGGTHEQNPNEGVIFGMDQEGIPNLVEEGEVIFRDYVFSNRIKVPKTVRKRHRLTDGVTFADAAKELAKESEERPNDPISQNGLEYLMSDLMTEQEMIKAKKEKNKFSRGGRVNKYLGGTPNLDLFDSNINTKDYSWMQEFKDSSPITQDAWYQQKIVPLATAPIDPKTTMASLGDSTAYPNRDNIPTIVTENTGGSEAARRRGQKGSSKIGLSDLRYIPAFGAAIGVTTDSLGWTNKPNYEPANMILEASKEVGAAPSVRFNPIGNYLTYKPFDRDYYINKLNAQAGASRRLLSNSGMSPGARAAAILAADNNYLNQLGSLARQAEEYNLAQRQQVENFNRATNQYNSEAALKADIANAGNRLKTSNLILESTIAGAKMRQAAKDASDAAKSANLTNLLDSLGNIGREEFARNMITGNPANYYSIDSKGNITYKGLDNASSYERSVVEAHANAEKKRRGFRAGGYLTIKRRKR